MTDSRHGGPVLDPETKPVRPDGAHVCSAVRPAVAPEHCVIVGAQKAGTTSLHAWLARHPVIAASDPKELHYFDRVERPTLDEYRRLFPARVGAELLLDATPAYLGLPYVAEKMAATVPEAKLVAILREPVARSHSAWWMHASRGNESRTFEQIVTDELASHQLEQGADDEAWMRKSWLDYMASVGSGHLSCPTFFLWGGLYARHLSRYHNHFGSDQMLVLLYEELTADPDAAAIRLGEFLDLDPAPLLGGLPSDNQAMGARTVALRRARTRPLGKLARAALPQPVWHMVRAVLTRGDRKPPIDQKTAHMLAEYYREPNAALAEMVGRELPW